MAKQTGIVSKLFIDGYDVSGDIGAVDSIALSRAQLDVTSIQSSFMERLPGLGDASISFSSFFNTAGAHARLSAMGTATKNVTVALGTAVGAAAATIVGPEVTYNTTRGADGSLVSQAEVVSYGGNGVEWGFLGTTATQSFAAAGSAATLDGLGSTSTGAAAVLHLVSIASGTATFKVQDSADDATYADVTGLAFTAASAITSQRVETAGTATLRRYTKVVATGTFGTAAVAVNIIRGL